MVLAGKQVKACFGTTKYCNAFLKGVSCNNPECLYLHDIGESCTHNCKILTSVDITFCCPIKPDSVFVCVLF